jgi:hypothetical protein
MAFVNWFDCDPHYPFIVSAYVVFKNAAAQNPHGYISEKGKEY